MKQATIVAASLLFALASIPAVAQSQSVAVSTAPDTSSVEISKDGQTNAPATPSTERAGQSDKLKALPDMGSSSDKGMLLRALQELQNERRLLKVRKQVAKARRNLKRIKQSDQPKSKQATRWTLVSTFKVGDRTWARLKTPGGAVKVHPGDKVPENYTVQSITKTSIKLSRTNEVRILYMGQKEKGSVQDKRSNNPEQASPVPAAPKVQNEDQTAAQAPPARSNR